MSEQKEKLVSQDYYNTEVAQESFRPWYSIAAVMIGYAISFSIPLVGAALGSKSATVSEGMTAILVGCIIMGVIGTFSAIIAVRTRLSFGLIMRQAFGRHGQMFFGIIFALLALSVWVFGGNLCAETLNKSFGISFYLAFPVIGVLFLISSYIGFKALQFLSFCFVPLILIGMTISAVNAVGSVGGLAGMEAIAVKAPFPYAMLVTLATSSFVLGYSSFVLDILRFAKTIRDGILAVWCSIGGLIIAILMGFFVGRVEGVGALSVALVGKHLFGPLSGVLLVLLITWSTLDNTMYSASLAFSSVLNLKKTTMIVILAAIGIVLGMGRLLAQFTPFISKFGLFGPALAGVVWTEFFLFSKGKWDKIENVMKKDIKGIDINYNALIALIVAGFASYNANAAQFFIAPPIVNIVTAIVVYYILGKARQSMKKGSELSS